MKERMLLQLSRRERTQEKKRHGAVVIKQGQQHRKKECVLFVQTKTGALRWELERWWDGGHDNGVCECVAGGWWA